MNIDKEKDPALEQDQKNEDDEFKRIEEEQKYKSNHNND